MTPLSVVAIVEGDAPALESAVQSWLSSGLDEVEVVLVALDPRAEQVAPKEGGRARVLRAARSSRVGAWAQGFAEAKGERVLLMRPDLLATPGLLQQHAAAPAGSVALGELEGVVLHPERERSLGPGAWQAAVRAIREPASPIVFPLSTLGITASTLRQHPAHPFRYLAGERGNLSLPRAAIESAGGLDRTLGDEPTAAFFDLLFRLQQAGAPFVAVPGHARCAAASSSIATASLLRALPLLAEKHRNLLVSLLLPIVRRRLTLEAAMKLVESVDRGSALGALRTRNELERLYRKTLHLYAAVRGG